MDESPPERMPPGRLAGAVGGAIHRYLRGVAPTVDVRGAAETQDRIARVRAGAPDRRLALYYWIEDALPLMLYGCCGRPPVAETLRFVCDDTVGGRVAAGVLGRLGVRASPLRLANDAARVHDVQQLIVGRSAIGIAVDGRGPYRSVGMEFARLVRRCEAVAVPLAIRVDRAWTLRAGATLRVPRRGAALVIAAGDAIEEVARVDELRDAMQFGLEDATRRAEARLTGAR